MKWLIKQAQNLVRHSDVASDGWVINELTVSGVGSSPWGTSFVLTDSSSGDSFADSTANSGSGSVSSGEIFAASVLVKRPLSLNSYDSLLRLFLGVTPEEFVAISFNPNLVGVPTIYSVGSATVKGYMLSRLSSDWFIVGLLARRDTSSGTAPFLRVQPTGGSGASATGVLEVSAAQIQRNEFGPYVRTTTSPISLTADYVSLQPRTEVVGQAHKVTKHRATTGNVTRIVYDPYDTEKINDRFVTRIGALKINCWWRNSEAVSLFDFDGGHVTSGYIANKNTPITGFSEPYHDQYSATIQLEKF